MKVVILAGGFGTRLAEETEIRPKPMVEIGGKPILWHILKHFAYYGHKEFYITLGYKGEYIKRCMVDHLHFEDDLIVDFSERTVTKCNNNARVDWKLHLIETGLKTQTGGRIKRLASYLANETFMVAHGDGLSDLNIGELLAFHREHGRLATIVAVRPPARFGHMEFDGDRVKRFMEKPQTAEGWINGGYVVFEPGVFDYIDGDKVQLERQPLERLASDGQLMAFRHSSFWQCLDTLRDKKYLQSLWDKGDAPWKISE